MDEPNPFRRPAALLKHREVRLQAFKRAAHGPKILCVDAKVLCVVGLHLLVMASLLVTPTGFSELISAVLSGKMTPTQAFTAAAAAKLLLCHVALWCRLYGSDPGNLVPGAKHPPPAEGVPPCPECGVAPTPRSYHCNSSGHCVQKLDHTCWFLSTAIGDLNHRAFLAMLCSQTSVLLWGLHYLFVKQRVCLSAAPAAMAACAGIPTRVQLMLLASTLVVCVALLFFLHMLALHLYLAVTNQTTLELLKGANLWYMRPYYLTHNGAKANDPSLGGCLALCLEHIRPRGRPPPAPFSAGLLGNLHVFFVEAKPYNHVPVMPVDSAALEEIAKAAGGEGV